MEAQQRHESAWMCPFAAYSAPGTDGSSGHCAITAGLISWSDTCVGSYHSPYNLGRFSDDDNSNNMMRLALFEINIRLCQQT